MRLARVRGKRTNALSRNKKGQDIMNVWVCRQNEALEAEIIDHFSRAGKWEKVVWCDNEMMRPKSQTSHESVELFSQHKCDPQKYPMSDDTGLQINQFMVFANRNSVLGGSELDSRSFDDCANAFWMLYSYTKTRLIVEAIDLVFFNRAPHYEGDYVLYLAAKELGLSILILQQSLIPNKFFYSFSMNGFNDIFSADPIFNSLELENAFQEGHHEKDLFYMSNVRSAGASVYRTIRERFRPEYHLLKRLLYGKERAFSVLRYKKQKEFKKNLKKMVEYDLDYDVPFVYFPLHLQPELTTSVFGGIFQDQLLAIEYLASALPLGWKIYVKENPKQNYMARGGCFFQRLNKIENVHLVPGNVSTYDLLRQCKISATITGTVGWEAISGLKPVIVFGDFVWYSSFPGVVKFSRLLDLEEVCKISIKPEDLNAALSSLAQRLGDGVIYSGYENLVMDFDSIKNAQDVCVSLEKLISHYSLDASRSVT